MTSPSDPRPGERPSDPSHDSDPVRLVDAPPSEAVTLADLIADAGPLPADAALECVQRLAERLTLTPRVSCESLGPADVLIDDDGGVWLRPEAGPPSDGPRHLPPQGMDRLGRLLAFLATGNGCHLGDDSAGSVAALPDPLSTVAARLFSRNGACYRSYGELANEAAVLRGVASPAPLLAETAEFDTVTARPEREPVPAEAESRVEERRPEPVAAAVLNLLPAESPASESASVTATEPTSPSWLGIGLIAAAIGGAGIAYLLWQVL